MTLCALFIALVSVCSMVSIPMPAGVPVSLALLAVFLCGLLLPPSWAVSSVAGYIALVAAGVPVTARGGAGVGYLLGPTGGYMIGYLATTLIVSMSTHGRSKRGRFKTAAAMALGLLGCYMVGTVWFVVVSGYSGTHYTFFQALTVCVIPFLPGDALKIIASMELAARLYPQFPQVLGETMC